MAHAVGVTDDPVKPEHESRRQRELRGKVAAFVRMYGKQHKYNDRQYDRKVERTVKRMKPGDLADILELGEDENAEESN